MKVREPVARPLDVVAVEMLLSASQALLVGVLMYLAVGIWADRGVGLGPVAVILGLLALAVGGGWLYWLMGGAGWLLAAANVPTSMFLGFALILGWQGDGLIQLDTLPLLLASSASVFGVIAGVFLDSPRRWRWDQRRKLRPGTQVPRVSATTRAAMARVPRSMPTRSTSESGPVAPVVGATSASVSGDSPPATTSDTAYAADVAMGAVDLADPGTPADDPERSAMTAGPEDVSPKASSEAGSPSRAFVPKVQPVDQTATPTSTGSRAPDTAADKAGASKTGAAKAGAAGEAIELPTSIEPKAQRSPWAWAAPPEWTRDEEDGEPDAPGSTKP